MPRIEITDEQIAAQFALLHDPKGSLRAIAEADRPASHIYLGEDYGSVERYVRHVDENIAMFGESTEG